MNGMYYTYPAAGISALSKSVELQQWSVLRPLLYPDHFRVNVEPRIGTVKISQGDGERTLRNCGQFPSAWIIYQLLGVKYSA